MYGNDIVVLTDQARVAADQPADQIPGYIAKYREGMASISMTPEEFARVYSVPLRITPTRLRGH